MERKLTYWRGSVLTQVRRGTGREEITLTCRFCNCWRTCFQRQSWTWGKWQTLGKICHDILWCWKRWEHKLCQEFSEWLAGFEPLQIKGFKMALIKNTSTNECAWSFQRRPIERVPRTTPFVSFLWISSVWCNKTNSLQRVVFLAHSDILRRTFSASFFKGQ